MDRRESGTCERKRKESPSEVERISILERRRRKRKIANQTFLLFYKSACLRLCTLLKRNTLLKWRSVE